MRPSLGEIRLGLEKVRIEPRSMSVLIALAERPRQVIPKKDLIEQVWRDAFVSDEVLTHAIWDLRRAFGDNATQPEFIQTIPKRGYRLIAPVREAKDVGGQEDTSRPAAERERRSGRERRRLTGGVQPRWRLWTLVSGLAATVLAAVWLAGSEQRAVARERREAQRQNLESGLLDDPDLAAWAAGTDDPWAVRDFVLGARYAFRNEDGSDRSMESAIARDPDFVAPWVWRAPSVAEYGPPEVVARYRAAYERLFHQATPFEKAMLGWAEAVLDDSLAEQARHLKIALEEAPNDRIARFNLAAAHYRMDDPEECWLQLRPLLGERWRFPALYTVGALCAVLRGSQTDLQETLSAALDNEPVDPEIYHLLMLLAVYRGDADAEVLYAAELSRRVREIRPEVYEFEVAAVAGLLARRAEEGGELGIARRLREFAD